MAHKIVEFDKSAKNDILAFFDKSVDEEGYVVEKANPTHRVMSIDGEEIKIEKFAGITKGSEVFIKSDLLSLIHLADRVQ